MSEQDMIQKKATKPLTEKQKKKIEKDLRRKKFADIVIQGTNDYSIVSKRSVEKLYTSVLNKKDSDSAPPPEYFKHFVKKFQRRSPTINRGYWTRMEAIKQSTYKIIQQSLSEEKEIVIINLGAGYDPLAFQYLDPQNHENAQHLGKLSFIDVDYPDLNKIKKQMIYNSPELQAIIGEETPSNTEGAELRTKNYTVLSCDLKNINLFLKQLRSLDLDNDKITKIFIAEVSIAYMLPQFADPVIGATSNLPNSHFLCLEQLLPAGPHQGFARTMLFHFSKLNSPLMSVSTYPTIPKQIERFKKAGYPVAEATDLMGFWRSLPKEVRDQVEKIEAFDELEEFVHFAQHYIILHATNSGFTLLDADLQTQVEAKEEVHNLCFKIQERTPEIERKFPAGAVSKDNIILLNGGASISRLKDTLFSSDSSEPWVINDSALSSRMTHSLSALSDGKFILVGGREGPNKPLSDCWVLNNNGSVHTWVEVEPLKAPRTRHSALVIDDEVLIYGGNFVEDPFIKFSGEQWVDVKTNGSLVSKKSSAVAYNGYKGVVIGGLDANFEITDTLHIFKVNGNEVITELSLQHPLLSRYGARAHFLSDDEVLLCGGVSDLFLHDNLTTIVKITLSTKKITTVKIPDHVWEKLPLLVGFELMKYRNSLVLVGGGEVCYSFGSIWNDILVIGEDDIPEFKQQK